MMFWTFHIIPVCYSENLCKPGIMSLIEWGRGESELH